MKTMLKAEHVSISYKIGDFKDIGLKEGAERFRCRHRSYRRWQITTLTAGSRCPTDTACPGRTRAEHVSISYKIGDFKDIGLKEWTMRHLKHQYRVETFMAVEDVSFELKTPTAPHPESEFPAAPTMRSRMPALTASPSTTV